MVETAKARLSSWWVALAAALLASVVFASLFGQSSYDVNGYRLGLSASPSYRGDTELAIPPFGEISARTHGTPLKLRVALERIYPSQISKVANYVDNGGELVEKLEADGKNAFKRFVLRLIAIAALGGALGAALAPRRRLLKAAAGALTGALFVGSLLLATYRTFDIHAFKQPRYSGALTAAPWAIDAIAKQLGDIAAFRQEIRSIAKNINLFYSKVDAWQPLRDDTIKVLHVSDFHNNPAAVDLTRRVAIDFKADFIIDTGDITDWGTPIETKLIEGIATLPVPYYFVPGNHDSPETIEYLKSVENVTVLQGAPVEIEGIAVLGIPDPASYVYEVRVPGEDSMTAMERRINETIDTMTVEPQVLAVHNAALAGRFFGKVPVVLTGHIHKAQLKEKAAYVMNNAGTTGAAGIRTFQNRKDVPYTLNLLHFERATKRLVAIDSLTVMGAAREFRLERSLIEWPDRDSRISSAQGELIEQRK
ncbi:MAG: metallophosphoesterase [Candidatus Aquicultor sp.]|nr:metallophosphoesterase [Candidatus Aquicultor sp.]